MAKIAHGQLRESVGEGLRQPGPGERADDTAAEDRGQLAAVMGGQHVVGVSRWGRGPPHDVDVRSGGPSFSVLTMADRRIKLDHCVIHVTDWDRSNQFYRDVLGAQLVDRGNATWAYRFGAEQLNVHGPGVNAGPLARVPVAPGNSDLCFEWPGPIEGAIAHLRAHVVAVEEGPVQRNGAKGPGRSVYFRDPDGSLMELISYAS